MLLSTLAAPACGIGILKTLIFLISTLVLDHMARYLVLPKEEGELYLFRGEEET